MSSSCCCDDSIQVAFLTTVRAPFSRLTVFDSSDMYYGPGVTSPAGALISPNLELIYFLSVPWSHTHAKHAFVDGLLRLLQRRHAEMPGSAVAGRKLFKCHP
eukprot:356613-Chlamydomonas_euryale.AAC.4